MLQKSPFPGFSSCGLIEETLDVFGIDRSLSMKGCPYNNVVAESAFKSIKFEEFVYQNTFHSLEQLHISFQDYVHWFNHFRIHGTLGYLSPIVFKKTAFKKLSSLVLTIQPF
jgi:transposase InsO family protein